MKSEVILDILIPINEDDFIVIKTAQKYYELRMGGFNILTGIKINNYETIDNVNWINKKIKRVLTDDYMMYIENDEGDGFSYGLTFISGEGENSLSLDYLNQEEFKRIKNEIFTDKDFYEINYN